MNRRDLLRNLGFGAAALVPVGASSLPPKKEDTVGPVLLERVCDLNKHLYTVEEIAAREAKGRTWGCGTKFQWYWGMGCVCPTCGWTYFTTFECLTKNKVSS